MEQDQRLTPLPRAAEIQANHGEYPATYAGFYDDESLASKRSLRQYFNIVYKRLPIIIAIALIVTAAVSFYSYRQPSIYAAQTEMIIEPRKPEVTKKDAININFGNDQDYYNTQLQLLQRSDLLKKVVIALNLHLEPNLFGEENQGVMASVRSIFGGSPKATTENTLPVVNEASIVNDEKQKIPLSPEEEARAVRYAARLAGGLKVDRVEDTNLVQITVSSSIPALSAKFADKLAEIFIQENKDRELEGANAAYDELSKSIEALKVTIAIQQSEQMQEQQNSGLPLQEKGGDLRAANLSTLQNQYNTAHDETGKLQAQYNAALSAAQSGDILSVSPDNKAILEARSQNLRRQAEFDKRIEDIDRKINEAKENREKLLSKYTEEYREVIAVTAQINELEKQKLRLNVEVAAKIKSEAEKLEKNAQREVLTSLRSQLGAAQQREERARVSYAQAASQANVEGQAETRLTTLKREIETNRNLLDTYTQRQKEQELAISGGSPNNIKISNKAAVPSLPIGPQRLRNIIVALLVSLAFGVGLAFLMDYLDDSVRTSDDVSRHLGLPTLALIPHHTYGDRKALSLIPKNGDGNGELSPSALVALEERNSPMAEAYRHLRTSLLFSSAGKPPQTILITSSQPSEGKTTTAINTAITLAQGDADVIIIDCDLRRPRLHSHFGLVNTHGLTNYLSGEKSTDNLIKTSPHLPRLKIITSGPIPPNPAELLSSQEMKNLLQFLRGRFKHVIIDSPPALSFTDAAILSTVVDGVVLVAMTGKSSIHLMRQFKLRLSNIGARIYGVVLNGVKSGSMDYDYYGTGYYDYYHRRTDDESTPLMEEVQAQHDTKA
ncbi:MAG: polysaccharide biosynthesis tyrosine autokinase [Acidobacteria bacterium]|nr:polysaccharide biosynthesis tyrosine autokinase [Acidobacteriota bacterium]MBK7933065.1 polysaccharide biosynthesis tyrosine autokinase [Acidobacteriota bacterium]